MLPPDVQAVWKISDEALERSLGQKIIRLEQISGGGNNRVFKVVLADNSLRVLKLYFRHPSDSRDRLGAEYGAVEFMWRHGIRVIPEPLGINRENHFAIYGFVDGAHKPNELLRSDLDQALSFAHQLKALCKSPHAKMLPSASEACFSIKALWDVLDARFKTLTATQGNPAQRELLKFLEIELSPFIAELKKFGGAPRFAPLPYDIEITHNQRTLSPSDFGFHNAILNSQGTWIFQDFEYFGWDDPSKLVADFILHPGMQLSAEQRAYVVQKGVECFGEDQHFALRLELVYPMYGVKWCLIVLNEFVPEFRARRAFSGAVTPEQLEHKQLEQLGKAQGLLEGLRIAYAQFAKTFELSSR